APARAYIDAVTAELARRAAQPDGPPGSPRALPGRQARGVEEDAPAPESGAGASLVPPRRSAARRPGHSSSWRTLCDVIMKVSGGSERGAHDLGRGVAGLARLDRAAGLEQGLVEQLRPGQAGRVIGVHLVDRSAGNGPGQPQLTADRDDAVPGRDHYRRGHV